jgi:uncharacterized protein (TIGR03437 family)
MNRLAAFLILALAPALGSPHPKAAWLFSGMPLRFDAEAGSRFVAHTSGYTVSLDSAGAEFDAGKSRVRMEPAGCGRLPEPVGEDPLPGRTNYFIGSAKPRRQGGVGSAGRVRYRDVCPGIDLLFYGSNGSLEFDFIVQPHADPRQIQLTVTGARLRLSAAGDLILGEGELRWKRPRLYQTQGGQRVEVAGGFQVRGRRIRFRMGRYDPGQPLVIDPVLSYSSYFGGAGNEAARALALDGSGNIYIAGYTTTSNLPVSHNAAQDSYGGQTVNFMTGDAFVAKFSPAGALLYLTYLGGSADDVASAIAVDAAGNAYVTGYTNSSNFPLSDSAPQRTYRGAGGNTVVTFGDAFVTKIGPNGDKILYSTYLGGSRDDMGLGITLNAAGEAYVTGTTLSLNFPTTSGVVQPAFNGGGGQPVTDLNAPFFIAGDGFIAKLNAAGTQFLWATYLGGKQDDTPTSIALDSAGNVYVAGATISADFPTTQSSVQPQYHNHDENQNPFFFLGDGFITKLSPKADTILYSTFLGGSGDDSVTAIAVDATGAVYVTGTTSSSNFPVTSNAFQGGNAGPLINNSAERVVGDAFVAKLAPTGGSLIFSTYLGGARDDAGYGIALGPDGAIYVTGQTTSTNFPVTSDAAQARLAGSGGQNNNGDEWGDAFLAVLSADGTKVTYATYLGGSMDDTAQGVAVDASGNVYVTGCTMSSDFHVTPNAAQLLFGGVGAAGRLKGDAWLGVFTPPPTPPPTSSVKLSAIENAASNAVGSVSPGMYFALYGSGIGPQTPADAALDSAGKLATTIGNVQVLFDSTPAPLVYASDGQINGIVPYSVQGKTAVPVVVIYQSQSSAALSVKVVDAVPAFFSADFSGRGQGAILNQDGSYNSASNPAAAGSQIVLFGTGEGQTIPAGVDGLIAGDNPPKPVLPVGVTIGGVPAEIAYHGGAPQEVAGALQLNVVIPSTVSSGNQPVVVKIGSASSPPDFTVAVRNP